MADQDAKRVPDGNQATPENIALAIGHSRNFATAKPDIGATEREHILGLCTLLERITVTPITRTDVDFGALANAWLTKANGIEADANAKVRAGGTVNWDIVHATMIAFRACAADIRTFSPPHLKGQIIGPALATPGLEEALLLADHASPMPAQAQAALQTLRRALASCLNCSPKELLEVATARHMCSDDGTLPPSEDVAPVMAP